MWGVKNNNLQWTMIAKCRNSLWIIYWLIHTFMNRSIKCGNIVNSLNRFNILMFISLFEANMVNFMRIWIIINIEICLKKISLKSLAWRNENFQIVKLTSPSSQSLFGIPIIRSFSKFLLTAFSRFSFSVVGDCGNLNDISCCKKMIKISDKI